LDSPRGLFSPSLKSFLPFRQVHPPRAPTSPPPPPLPDERLRTSSFSGPGPPLLIMIPSPLSPSMVTNLDLTPFSIYRPSLAFLSSERLLFRLFPALPRKTFLLISSPREFPQLLDSPLPITKVLSHVFQHYTVLPSLFSSPLRP